jgi:hypothetical protein
MAVNLNTWILGPDAAQRLGISVRTVRKMVASGELHPERVPIAGQSGPGTYFYNPDEVEALRVRRQAEKTHIVPDTRELMRSNGVTYVGSNAKALEPLPPVIKVPPRTVEWRRPNERMPAAPALPIDRKRYLTPEEAVIYTGLGLFHIEAKLGRGLPIGPHGSRVYRRDKLERL